LLPVPTGGNWQVLQRYHLHQRNPRHSVVNAAVANEDKVGMVNTELLPLTNNYPQRTKRSLAKPGLDALSGEHIELRRAQK
jgi:hypothetical protein